MSNQNATGGDRNPNIILSCAFSAVVLSIASIHLFWKKLDATFLGLVAIAAVPWLAAFLKKMELPGGWKFEFQELKKQLEETRGTAESANMKAETATELASAAPPGRSAGPAMARPESTVAAELEELAKEYNGIRDSQKPGWRRTSNMTAVVSKMIAAARDAENLDPKGFLSDRDGGRRLIAYAATYARPKCDYLDNLVTCLTTVEDSHFGQYWAIQAIKKVMAVCEPSAIAPELVAKLQRFLEIRLNPGEDRYAELSRLLKGLK